MSTDFSNNNLTINPSGGFYPTTKNTPVDMRQIVNLYNDIKDIPNPYVGMPITVLTDENNNNKMTQYRVKSLKANALGVANMLVNEVISEAEYLGVNSVSGGFATKEYVDTAISNLSLGSGNINMTVLGSDEIIEWGDPNSSGGDTTVSVAGVSMNWSETSVNKDATTTLEALISPTGATNKNVTWSVNNSNVSLNPNGLYCTVTGVTIGNSIVTVTTADGNYTATCTVSVVEATTTVSVESVSLNKSTASIQIGNTEQLTATVLPENATNKNVTWSSSAASIASVNNGLITAKAQGSATITVKTVDQSKTATCEVTVTPIPVKNVSLDKTSLSLEEAATATLIATVSPTNATNKNVTWSSSDDTIATVSNGTITAVKAGNCDITVTTVDGNYSAICSIIVTAAGVIEIPTDGSIITRGQEAIFNFRNKSGTSIADDTGNYTATFYNMTESFSADGLLYKPGSPTGWLSIANLPSGLFNNGCTIVMQQILGTASNNVGLFGIVSDDNNTATYNARLMSSNGVRIYNNNDLLGSSNTSLTASAKNHIAFRLSSSKAEIFINGVKDISLDTTISEDYTKIIVGACKSSTCFPKGTLQSFYIYNKQLADEEITYLYNYDSNL